MKRWVFAFVFSLFCFQLNGSLISELYLGSRESDPAGLVENVSVIHGDYTEVEVDLTVNAPDSLVLSRFYSSRDTLQIASFGGWRFNPHCFLKIEKDPKGKNYTSAGGKFERTYAYVGNPDGTILTYVGWQNATSTQSCLFKIDVEEDVVGLSNTAKGEMSCWTNSKNNALYFDPQTDSFELVLCSEGKRFYTKHPINNYYFITQEILPSGNKIFYEFNDEGQLGLIRETNASEKKVLAWIKIQYGNGIHVETSDGKSVDYQFEKKFSATPLLTSVLRSHKPNLHYQYQVVDHHAFLVKKSLPEGRFVEINYDIDTHKVMSVTTPEELNKTTTIQFTYKNGHTQVEGPGTRKAVYTFNEDKQLIALEQYLDGSLYRVHKKSWGRGSDAGNLISISLEDNVGGVFYHKNFSYDVMNNIVEEREYGDMAGTGLSALVMDDNGVVTSQDGHIKNYSYFSGKNTHGVFQRDLKGTGVKYWYKKGTNLLLKKFILTNGALESEDEDYNSGIKERHFYIYNEDAALMRVIIDDGKKGDLKELSGVKERRITEISPKQELPNAGFPEMVEQKYSSSDGKAEFLLQKTVNQFDAQGYVASQAIYDANNEHRYTLNKRYSQGLLTFETDPMGKETHYAYDANRNLVQISHSTTGVSIEYGYDLRNRPVYL